MPIDGLGMPPISFAANIPSRLVLCTAIKGALSTVGSGTDGKDWLPVKRLLLQIDKLTGKKKMIAANYRRRIENILATTATVNDDDEDDHDDDGEGDD